MAAETAEKPMTRGVAIGARLAALFLALVSLVLQQALADTQVSGRLTGKDGFGTFTCIGAPTCNGTLNVTSNAYPTPGRCTNSFVWSSAITITGVDLTKTAFSGNATIALNEDDTMNPDGSCNYTLDPGSTSTYTATWDATTSSGTIIINAFNNSGQSQPITGTFTASAPAPVFPMTVTGSVTTTTTDIEVTIQPRAQDVGTQASVYVFAHAPANLVTGASGTKLAPSAPGIPAKPEDQGIVCVLAQVNPSGQLVAVSASTMQAYLSGVLNAQSQGVQILNNEQTSKVAGASFFIGYASSAAAMFSSGIYQTVTSVPGGVQCTANFASAPAPTLPGAITGLWWNANESGWGIHFTQRGSNIFAAWYTYDSTGNPKWYVAPQCAGMTGTSGTCTGSLYQVNGPTFFGAPFVPITSNQVSQAGTFRLTFTDANNGSMNYTVGTVTRTVSITRQPVGVGSVAPAVDYTDLWWNPNESGWGMAMAQQNANIFLAWYVYDNTGKPVWYVASNCTVSGSSCSGTLYSTTGPPFGPTFSGPIQVTTAGSVIVSFLDANNAVLSYTVGNVTATKPITRQLF